MLVTAAILAVFWIANGDDVAFMNQLCDGYAPTSARLSKPKPAQNKDQKAAPKSQSQEDASDDDGNPFAALKKLKGND